MDFVKWSIISAAIAWIVAIIIMVVAGLNKPSYDGYDSGYYDYDTTEAVEPASSDYYDSDEVYDSAAVEVAPADYYPEDTTAW